MHVCVTEDYPLPHHVLSIQCLLNARLYPATFLLKNFSKPCQYVLRRSEGKDTDMLVLILTHWVQGPQCSYHGKGFSLQGPVNTVRALKGTVRPVIGPLGVPFLVPQCHPPLQHVN